MSEPEPSGQLGVSAGAPAQTAKALTLRLPLALAEELELVARIDKCSQNEVVRRAINAYLHTRRNDPGFQHRAALYMAKMKNSSAAALAEGE